ncbi:MAG: hypothetical protein HOG89_02580 [Candidatus Peribacter sp.]|jgi:uncharacterized protein YkwD|nr:hypothetical protein [Candidatus Peribacter sp.]MBT4392554.1 hypothetical protein [Candidatus Peribacter sp.]MBT4601409.1 hypothetical protein [Candidatus Peribacter sp.]MBT5149126.1 hypothetical protein [Candidatus Peribacter sp.]MBT5638099.1 hypothetical protein [Candidatus Peribacter sp.]
MRKFISSVFIGLLTFAPLLINVGAAQEPITYVRRAEAAMILMKNAGITVEKDVQTFGDYPDMIDGQWYAPYMIKAIKLGLLTPDPSTSFAYPHKSVTRAEFLMMTTKVFDLTTNIPYQYTDIPVGANYSPYVGLSWRYKLIGNKQNPNLFQPELKITHKEAAMAIYTLLTAEPSLQPEPDMFPVKEEHYSAPKDSRSSFFENVTISVATTTSKLAKSYTDIATPKTVKSAVLGLIRSRGSLAEQTRNDLIHAVNEERAKFKLTPIRSNYYLEVSAQRHAKDMAERGYFSHYTPEGLSYVDRIRGGGYLDINPNSCSCAQQFDLGGESTVEDQGPDFILTGLQECSCEPIFSLGENLAKGQLSVKQVMEDWMNSPNHRRNILRPEFEEIGIGLFEDEWVQNFGRLKFN